MQITPCLVFNSNCREAFETYARVLGGELTAMIANKDMPGNDNPWAAERPDNIIHAWLQIGDQAIMGNDSPPDYIKLQRRFPSRGSGRDAARVRRLGRGRDSNDGIRADSVVGGLRHTHRQVRHPLADRHERSGGIIARCAARGDRAPRHPGSRGWWMRSSAHASRSGAGGHVLSATANDEVN